MTTIQSFLFDAVCAINLVALMGVLWRRRYRLCWSFAAYLAAAILVNRLGAWWPDRFYTPSFWILKSALLALLVFMVAIEIAGLVFQAFPGARPALQAAFLIALVVTAIGALWVPEAQRGDYATILNHLQPRVVIGASWLFGAVLGLTFWYNIPLHEFHRDVAVGFAANCVITGVLWSGIYTSPAFDSLLRVGYQAIGVGVCLFWARAAWRREVVPAAPRALVRELQPWRE